jgi:signal transduction histidine kinase
MVSVRDTGVGISQLEQSRIFEPFYTTKGNRGGTGLGLSVTYGIITDHGGQIDVESQPGVGSQFNVWLPIVPSPSPNESRPSPVAQGATQTKQKR